MAYNNREGSLSRAFESAAINGDYQSLRKLLQTYGEFAVNYRNTLRQTLAHLSIEHPGCLKLLYQQGIDINAPDEFGKTPLYLACERNNVRSINFLISNYAKDEPIEFYTENGHIMISGKDEPIEFCMENKNGHKIIVEKYGMDLFITSNNDYDTKRRILQKMVSHGYKCTTELTELNQYHIHDHCGKCKDKIYKYRANHYCDECHLLRCRKCRKTSIFRLGMCILCWNKLIKE